MVWWSWLELMESINSCLKEEVPMKKLETIKSPARADNCIALWGGEEGLEKVVPPYVGGSCPNPRPIIG